MEPKAESIGPPRRRGGPILLLATAIVLTVWGFRGVGSLGLSDIDGPTLLRVSRVERPQDLLQVVSMEYRDDPRSGAGFYRPLTSLTFALDQLLYGSARWPLHLVDLLIHLGVGVALYALARRLGVSDWGAAVAAALAMLHPIGAEVVPSIARRSESLAMLLLTVALWLEARGSRRGALLAALGAALSKESGFLAVFLLPAVAPASFGRRRWLLLAGGAIGLIVLRALVVGGLIGGYEDKFVSFGQLPRALLDLLDGGRLLGLWGARAAALLFVVLVARRLREPALRVGMLWLAGALGLTQLSSGLGAWYLYAALPGLGLLCGALLAGKGRARWLALPLALTAIAGSPAWIDYPEWDESARWNQRLREAALAALEPSTAGPVILAGLPAHQGRGPGHRFHLRSVNVALGWSLRDAIYLETGREIEIFGAAHVALDAAPADYALRASRRGAELEFTLDGPAMFTSGDLASERFGEREIPFTAESSRDRVLLRDPRAPVFYWDGERFAPAP